VEACAAALAQDIESTDRALSVIIYLDTSAAVVRCRAYRNHIFGDVNTDREALLVDVREVVFGLLGRHMGNIEIYKLLASNLQFVVNRTSHNISRSQ
jgi:hypothetical protein